MGLYVRENRGAEPWNRNGVLSVTLDRDGAATFLLDEGGIPLNGAQKTL